MQLRCKLLDLQICKFVCKQLFRTPNTTEPDAAGDPGGCSLPKCRISVLGIQSESNLTDR